MPQTNSLDLSTPASADKALTKISTLMGRAGQPVVAHELNPKAKRSSDTTYREAYLTLASGQQVTLRVNSTGDIYQVLLNSAVQPLKEHTDTDKAVVEIAGLAQKNQAKFQKAQARRAVALPKGMSTPKPKIADALAEQVAGLDAQIADRKATLSGLQGQLKAAGMLDSASSLAPELAAGALDADTQEALRVFARFGVVDANALPNPATLESLIELGYVKRSDGVLAFCSITDKGRAAVEALNIAPAPLEPATSGAKPEPISWLGFKIVNEAYAQDTGPMPVPSAHQIGADVTVSVGPTDNPTTIAAKVLGANFRASKVHYALAVPVDAIGDQKLYAVLHDVDSVFVTTAGTQLDSAQPLLVLDDHREPLPVPMLDAAKVAEMDDATQDVLRQLGKAEGQALDDGDVCSKTGRDTLCQLGLIDRYTTAGANVLNDKGREAFAMLDSARAEPGVLLLGSAYVAAHELRVATGVMLDDASTEGAKATLQIALDVAENNCPISLEEGDVAQARHQMNMARSFKAAMAMLDDARVRPLDDKALEQLVAIAKADAASEDEIADQNALAALLAHSLVDVAEGIYFLSEAGRQHLNANGMDAYGEPFAE